MLKNKAQTISDGCHHLFQVRLNFNCESLKLNFPNITDHFQRSIVLHPLAAHLRGTGGCNLLSSTQQ